MYDEIIVAQLEEKGYENAQQLLHDFAENQLLCGDDFELYGYLQKVHSNIQDMNKNPTNPIFKCNTFKK